ncbi:MAG TPA: sigma 54-interacting transcriptional regulator [Opitutaceae bacterium]|nr:sigma 54-interacting transcriptional regulator [Opitutaceae bacterium]
MATDALYDYDFAKIVSRTAANGAGVGEASHDHEFYRRVLESLSESVLITDAQWRILYANPLIQKITGYAPEELIGLSPQQVFVSARHTKNGECDQQDPLSETEDLVELEIKTKSGELRWVALKTTPFRNAEGRVIGRVSAMGCIEKQKALERENEVLLTEVRENFGDIVGDSLALKKVLSQIATVAPTEAGVLVLGESGTGKELVARAVHELSPRKSRPLVRVNCASIPKELFESEFFGHVRGAFTGAIKDRIGRFELADGGTLFLDEVGEIPLELQGKLLRVLQEGQFERVGDERTRRVNVRIIAATNRDLLAEAKAGRFRIDLYYRLSVFPIELPPLRERIDDIEPLVSHFIRQAARRLGVPLPRLTKSHLHQLRSYDWPGNIRELQNVIERAVILSRGGRLHLELPQSSNARQIASPRLLVADAASEAGANHEPASLDDLASKKRAIIEAALARTKGKIYGPDGAAALLNMKPTTLSSMVKRQNLARGTAGRS